MSFNAIRENKILMKISGITVINMFRQVPPFEILKTQQFHGNDHNNPHKSFKAAKSVTMNIFRKKIFSF